MIERAGITLARYLFIQIHELFWPVSKGVAL